MVSQERQTLSCLFKNRTGLIGAFPNNKPREVVFTLENGTPLRLIGFNLCHPSIVKELGQRKIAGFTESAGKEKVSRKNWRGLMESANAVLFTPKGRIYKVEILKRVPAPTQGSDGIMTVCFKKTKTADEFIPCG